MGRLKAAWGSNLNPLFSGKYKKLLEDYGTKDYSRLLLQESLQDYLSYACRECGHVQKLQAEELNSIVSHAFRLAYAAHLQKSASASTTLKSDHVIPTSQHLAPPHTPAPAVSHNNTSARNHGPNRQHQHCQLSSSSSSPAGVGSVPSCGSGSSMRTPGSSLSPGAATATSQCKPSKLSDLHSHHQYPVVPDNSNSLTGINSNKSQADKPPLIKKHTVPLENNLQSTLNNNIENTLENNLEIGDCQILVTSNTLLSSSCESSFHQVGQVTSSQVMAQVTSISSSTSTAMVGYANDKVSDGISSGLSCETQCHDHNIRCNHLSDDAKMNRLSQISLSSNKSSGVDALDPSISSTQSGTLPPLPDRSDSLTPPEGSHLKSAPWFQAGIPREIALEVLSREPVGAFMVRESTSKPGCYALSLRVPRHFTMSGIAHYLIVNNNNGFKIKGFTKEFTTLTALIIHHSVMPELLPCPLSLSRYSPTSTNDHNRPNQNDDPDYNTLSDFSQ